MMASLLPVPVSEFLGGDRRVVGDEGSKSISCFPKTFSQQSEKGGENKKRFNSGRYSVSVLSAISLFRQHIKHAKLRTSQEALAENDALRS